MVSYEHNLKVVLLGSNGVGKTELTPWERSSRVYYDCVGTDLSIYSTFLPNTTTKIKMVIWEINVEKRFDLVRNSLWLGAMGAILVWDISDRDSFIETKNLWEKLSASIGLVPVLCVANKTDLLDEREVTTEEGLVFCSENGFEYVESSRNNRADFEHALNELSERIVLDIEERYRKELSDSMAPFDDLAIAYDSTIEWESRLSREIPFLKKCTASTDARILDMACGSGRHALELAKEGYEVHAFDTSETMIQLANKHSEEEGIEVEFKLLDMLKMSYERSSFDLIYCLGNSLSLLNDINEFATVINLVYQSLSKGGTFVFQILNFEEIIANDFRFMPSKAGKLASGETVVFNRYFDHEAGEEHSTLVMTSLIKHETEWKVEMSTQNVLRLNLDVIQTTFHNHGFTDYVIFSDYAGDGFVQSLHRNMIVKARK